jgi:hypothetical protein
MRVERIRARVHRIGIAIAGICAVLALLNLFNNDPRSARNAAELVAIGLGIYLLALVLGWVIAALLSNKRDHRPN